MVDNHIDCFPILSLDGGKSKGLSQKGRFGNFEKYLYIFGDFRNLEQSWMLC